MLRFAITLKLDRLLLTLRTRLTRQTTRSELAYHGPVNTQRYCLQTFLSQYMHFPHIALPITWALPHSKGRHRWILLRLDRNQMVALQRRNKAHMHVGRMAGQAATKGEKLDHIHENSGTSKKLCSQVQSTGVDVPVPPAAPVGVPVPPTGWGKGANPTSPATG